MDERSANSGAVCSFYPSLAATRSATVALDSALYCTLLREPSQCLAACKLWELGVVGSSRHSWLLNCPRLEDGAALVTLPPADGAGIIKWEVVWPRPGLVDLNSDWSRCVDRSALADRFAVPAFHMGSFIPHSTLPFAWLKTQTMLTISTCPINKVDRKTQPMTSF